MEPPAASYCLGDVIVCNDYKDNSGVYSGNGYVYYVNSFDSSAGNYTGSYFSSSHGSAGTSGGGATSTNTTPSNDDIPPSCESFNFSQKASLWQTALVKNISFNIILLSEKGVTFMHSAKFRQPISFGMPTTHTVGGALISPEMAAELSAKALQITIREVVAKYGRVKVSEMIVEQYFKERLLINYPMVTSGGRVNWTTTENLPVTDYETTFMLPDGCQ